MRQSAGSAGLLVLQKVRMMEMKVDEFSNVIIITYTIEREAVLEAVMNATSLSRTCNACISCMLAIMHG